ncbi:MAG: phosphotransferase family protein [Candidatus Sumerlaeaceae bacterium]
MTHPPPSNTAARLQFSLPADASEFAQQKDDAALWDEVIARIAASHALTGTATRLGGSCIVYAIGDAVIKLHEPWNRELFATESEVLRALHDRLPVATPALLHSGEMEGCAPGWHYLVMSRVPGEPLDTVWPQLSQDAKRRVLGQLGEITCALHSLSVDDFSLHLHPDWNQFILEQTTNCVQRQRILGLCDEWLQPLPAYLETLLPTLQASAPRVLLHTELMGGNVLLQQLKGEWHISALIDFEPSMVGRREYDFAAVAAFLTRGDARLLRTFLHGYGLTTAEINGDLRMRIAGWMLLHRYANVPWYFKMMPGSGAARNWSELETCWAGLS